MVEPIQVPEEGLAAINHYVATQVALGNWPRDSVWGGDLVLLALLDTYEAVASYDSRH